MDPVWARYLKLRALTPQCLRFAAPPRAGECGWKIDGGVVNWDVAIVQERLQFLYFGGVFDWLDARPRPLTVLEIGAGSGLFASAFIRARPGARYVLCDLPEVLCVAFAYLNLVLPDRRHLIALPGPELVDAASGAAAAIDSSGGEVIYLPNYLVGAADRLIAPNMIVNAMSLPEMGAGQIAYYAEFMARALDRTRGIYVDINAPKGGDNPLIDPVLRNSFASCRPIPLQDLGLAARLWSNHGRTLERIAAAGQARLDGADAEAAFRFDWTAQYPDPGEGALADLLTVELGDFIGVDFRRWLRERGYHFGNHLERLRKLTAPP